MHWHMIPQIGTVLSFTMFYISWRDGELDYTFLVVGGILLLITVHIYLLQEIRQYLKNIYYSHILYGALDVNIVNKEKPDAEGEE